VDFAKLIEQRDKFMAEAAATLKRGGTGSAAISPAADLQAEQAGRVRLRIESLETRRKEFLAGIDAELAGLKRDLKAREQKIAGERENYGLAAGAPAAGGASDAKKERPAASAAAKKKKAPARPASKKKSAAAKKRP
jgi:hypothetical protein